MKWSHKNYSMILYPQFVCMINVVFSCIIHIKVLDSKTVEKKEWKEEKIKMQM
jgi:hypothetical protein